MITVVNTQWNMVMKQHEAIDMELIRLNIFT